MQKLKCKAVLKKCKQKLFQDSNSIWKMEELYFLSIKNSGKRSLDQISLDWNCHFSVDRNFTNHLAVDRNFLNEFKWIDLVLLANF